MLFRDGPGLAHHVRLHGNDPVAALRALRLRTRDSRKRLLAHVHGAFSVPFGLLARIVNGAANLSLDDLGFFFCASQPHSACFSSRRRCEQQAEQESTSSGHQCGGDTRQRSSGTRHRTLLITTYWRSHLTTRISTDETPSSVSVLSAKTLPSMSSSSKHEERLRGGRIRQDLSKQSACRDCRQGVVVRVRAWALMSAAVQPAVAGIAFTIDGAPVRLARRYPGEWLLDPGPVALAEVTVAQWPVQDARLGAGLVQDLYLTTSPKPGGEPDTPLYPRPLQTRTIE
jgi:hypothetical protein